MRDINQPTSTTAPVAAWAPTTIHLLPGNREDQASRGPQLEERVVHSVEPANGGAKPRVTVARPFERPMVWVGEHGAMYLEPGDTVRALWYQAMVWGWGPVAKTMCVDPGCVRAVYRLAGVDAAVLAPNGRHPHFRIIKRM